MNKKKLRTLLTALTEALGDVIEFCLTEQIQEITVKSTDPVSGVLKKVRTVERVDAATLKKLFPPKPKLKPVAAGQFVTVTRKDGSTFQRRARRWHRKPETPPVTQIKRYYRVRANPAPPPKPKSGGTIIDQAMKEIAAPPHAPKKPAADGKTGTWEPSEAKLPEFCDDCHGQCYMRYPCLGCGVNVCEPCAKKGDMKEHLCEVCKNDR